MIKIGDVIPSGPNKGKIKLGDGKYGDGLPVLQPGKEPGPKPEIKNMKEPEEKK